jgi:hypothetical protein
MNMPERESTLPTVSVAQFALATLSLAAAAIHFAVMGEHFTEYVAYGIFFATVAWLQALWAVGVTVRPTRILLLGGLVGNAIVVWVWIVSRTAGLPIGPEPHVAEPAALVDALSTIFEVAIVAGTVVLLAGRGPKRNLQGRTAWLGALAFVVVLSSLTTWAIATHVPAGGSHGAALEDGGETVTDGRPGYARVDLGGDGRVVQVLVDPAGSVAQVHLTFFDSDGQALDVRSMSMSGRSPGGETVEVPASLFELGHFAGSTDLAPGAWTFRVQGVAADDLAFDVSFPLTIE